MSVEDKTTAQPFAAKSAGLVPIELANVHTSAHAAGSCARKRAAMSYPKIADMFGVTPEAVRYACDDEARAKMHAYSTEWQRGGKCVDCGAQCTRNHARCLSCGALARASSVQPDRLWCASCSEWKPDKDFPRNANKSCRVRRGRHSECQACNTIARRKHRDQNKVPCASPDCDTLVLAPGNGQHAGTGMCLPCAARARYGGGVL